MVVPASLVELGPGAMVGEYRIEGLLGEGGMGRVYSAIHPIIAKRAAIKVLHPELSVNQDAVDRFAQEARAVNQIGHDNIVDIFSFGKLPDGRSYFVMERLRGQSLRDRLRESPLPIQQALRALDVIAIALEAAHEVGIVHRDLKPDNIFLCEKKGAEPTVKLLDFGIAKLLGAESKGIERTQTGNLLGTPAYISPEQARGQHVDHRTDIYALGCLTYELFTGSLPFPAQSAADMLAKHLFEPPPSARVLNPSVPVQLDQLIAAMLSKDAANRPTLEQFRGALQPYSASGFNPAVGGVLGHMHTPPRMAEANFAAMVTPTGGVNAVYGRAETYAADSTRPVRNGVSKVGAIIGGALAVAIAATVTMIVMTRDGDKQSPTRTPPIPMEVAPSVTPIVTPPAPPTPEAKPVTKVDDTKVEPTKVEPAVAKPIKNPRKATPTRPTRPARPNKPSKPVVDDRDDAM